MHAKNLRNICIIAHVDHGKTTLVDHVLRYAGSLGRHNAAEERVMDSMDLERERGITIAAKNAAVEYQGHKINIVDTPGHADFGGEVERIMSMADGALLLVDAAEGPLPQTRFVLKKALAQGHKLILVINKVDRHEVTMERIREVEGQVFDLFVDLGANDIQGDFPIVYACARKGWLTLDFNEVPTLLESPEKGSMGPLLDMIIEQIPPPKIEQSSHFKMLAANIGYSDYVGTLAIGRVTSGSLKKGQQTVRHCLTQSGESTTERFSAVRLYKFQSMNQVEAENLTAGDIGIVAGCENVEIGDTLVDDISVEPLPRIAVEKPTIGISFSVNTSPLSGQEGEAIQSRKLRERLLRECRHNVALRFEDGEGSDQFRLLGRGELQFAILIEQMRRDGLEFMVGRPVVLFQTSPQGERQEPFEQVHIDVPDLFSGEVTQMLQNRRGILTSFENAGSEENRVRMVFTIPTRGLLGIRSRFLTATRGEGIMSSEVLGYQPHKGDISHRGVGALISDRSGETVEYALRGLEDRGSLFMGVGIKVYEGMIIGECAKEHDLNVNPCKEKKLTNVRSVNSDVLVHMQGITKMTLEKSLEWIDDDEWIEITPLSIRLRKKVLQKNMRSVRREDRIK